MVSFSQNVHHGTTNLKDYSEVTPLPGYNQYKLGLPSVDRRVSVVFYLHHHMEESDHGKDIDDESENKTRLNFKKNGVYTPLSKAKRGLKREPSPIIEKVPAKLVKVKFGQV